MPRTVNRTRPKTPKKLASKLLAVRQRLNESQNGMIIRLGLMGEYERGYVSKWERGLLEPPLFVLLAYSNTANIFLEVLVSDDLNLPLDLPAKTKSMGLDSN